MTQIVTHSWLKILVGEIVNVKIVTLPRGFICQNYFIFTSSLPSRHARNNSGLCTPLSSKVTFQYLTSQLCKLSVRRFLQFLARCWTPSSWICVQKNKISCITSQPKSCKQKFSASQDYMNRLFEIENHMMFTKKNLVRNIVNNIFGKILFHIRFRKRKKCTPRASWRGYHL